MTQLSDINNRIVIRLIGVNIKPAYWFCQFLFYNFYEFYFCYNQIKPNYYIIKDKSMVLILFKFNDIIIINCYYNIVVK